MDITRINTLAEKLFNNTQIKTIEDKYSGSRFIGDFCLRDKNGNWANFPAAVFYQPKPEKPEYSNYFAIYYDSAGLSLMITNGLSAVSGIFEGVVADDGEIIFSRWRHDYRVSADNSVIIDGGRDYTKISVGSKGTKAIDKFTFVKLKIVDGMFQLAEQ